MNRNHPPRVNFHIRLAEGWARARGIHRLQLLLRLEVGDAILLARITRKSADHLGLRPGQPLFAQTKALALLN